MNAQNCSAFTGAARQIRRAGTSLVTFIGIILRSSARVAFLFCQRVNAAALPQRRINFCALRILPMPRFSICRLAGETAFRQHRRMITPSSQQRELTDKLHLLRRLDRFRAWESLDDRRLCLGCGRIITGREIRVSGGTRPFDPVLVSCPTRGSRSIPMDWALPNDRRSGLFEAESNQTEPVENVRATASSETQTGADAEELAHSVLRRAWRAFSAARGRA